MLHFHWEILWNSKWNYKLCLNRQSDVSIPKPNQKTKVSSNRILDVEIYPLLTLLIETDLKWLSVFHLSKNGVLEEITIWGRRMSKSRKYLHLQHKSWSASCCLFKARKIKSAKRVLQIKGCYIFNNFLSTD